jgi:hypothetical protein
MLFYKCESVGFSEISVNVCQITQLPIPYDPNQKPWIILKTHRRHNTLNIINSYSTCHVANAAVVSDGRGSLSG